MFSPTSIETKAPKKKNRPALSFRDDDLINRKTQPFDMANHDVRRIKKVPATSCTQNFSTPMIAEVNSLDFEAEIAHVVEDRSKTLSVGAKGKGRQPNLGVPAKKRSNSLETHKRA
jgi:hypothetical protein